MRTRTNTAVLIFAFLLVALPVRAQEVVEVVDEEANAAIRRHGLEESRVMELMGWLTDVYGPRLTGSPVLMQASEWAVERLEAWGLQDAHLEPWGPFGRGWTLERFSMNATSPVPFPVLGYPEAWSGATNGLVEADAVIFNPGEDDDLSAYEGRLAGKIVMMDDMRQIREPFEAPAERHDAEDLLALANAASPEAGERRYTAEQIRRLRTRTARFAFVYGQRPAAILELSSFRGDYGTVMASGASVPAPPEAGYFDRPTARDVSAGDVIPQIAVAAEHYNRLYRQVERGLPVRIALDVAATYHTDDLMAYNVVAEIPGTDPEIGDEVVMLGAHIDSWHAGTGATDNAAGVAVMMEAVRILQEVFEETGRRPRRTIRIALWSGEEQGLLGSRAYVGAHFAELGGRGDPPTAIRPAHEKVSAYYNLDNGTGRIRGIYLQDNAAVQPIFRAWLAPFQDLDATTLTISNTSSTDHIAFDAVGLPGFQFIQDPVAYAKTHHSNMDVYDHAVAEDLQQAATIVASIVYHTAQRDEKLPRKPLELAEPSEGASH